MADQTNIEWTDATWNPITGCSIVSPGCTNCYAMKPDITALKSIVPLLETATEGSRELDIKIATAIGWTDIIKTAAFLWGDGLCGYPKNGDDLALVPIFTTSLDAIDAVTREVLPNFMCEVIWTEKECVAFLFKQSARYNSDDPRGAAATEPLARTLAFIKALMRGKVNDGKA
jgi:hypothetical protein